MPMVWDGLFWGTFRFIKLVDKGCHLLKSWRQEPESVMYSPIWSTESCRNQSIHCPRTWEEVGKMLLDCQGSPHSWNLRKKNSSTNLIDPSPPCSGASQVALVVKKPTLIPGLGRFPGGGHGNPLQYSCLENPMDTGAWWVSVHVVTKSQTWLK